MSIIKPRTNSKGNSMILNQVLGVRPIKYQHVKINMAITCKKNSKSKHTIIIIIKLVTSRYRQIDMTKLTKTNWT